MARIARTLAVGIAFLVFAAPVFSQSEEEGTRLFNEALKIHKEARSGDDLIKAVPIYENALRIFEKINYKPGIAATANNIAMIYISQQKVVESLSYIAKVTQAGYVLWEPYAENFHVWDKLK